MITSEEKYRAAVAIAQAMLTTNYATTHVAYYAVSMADDIARRVLGENQSPEEKEYHNDLERWRLEKIIASLKDTNHR